MTFHETLKQHSPAAVCGFRALMTFTHLLKSPTGSAESELGEMQGAFTEFMPLAREAAKLPGGGVLKDFNRSRNTHKGKHAPKLIPWLGQGGGDDEQGELLQKLVHLAYRHFSSKQGDLLLQLSSWLQRHTAVQQGQLLISLCNADLIFAAEIGATDIVQHLLTTKGVADLFVADESNRCRVPANDALVAAATHGHEGCVQVLLEAKANINARAPDGQTALIAATRHGRTEVVKQLVTRGAPQQPTWSRLNALQWAHFTQDTATTAALLPSGAPPSLSQAPPRAPAPRSDPSQHRLRPPLRTANSSQRYLDLTQLRAQRGSGADPEERRALRSRFPELAQHLEYSLRVRCALRLLLSELISHSISCILVLCNTGVGEWWRRGYPDRRPPAATL